MHQVVAERIGGWIAFQERPERLPAVVRAERRTCRAQARARDDLAVREDDVPGIGEVHEAAHRITVLRETPVVALRGGAHLVVAERIHVIRVTSDRTETPGDVHIVEGARVGGEVRQRGESAERLTEHAPGVRAQVLAHRLAVADDRIGAEVREVFRHGLRTACEISVADRSGQAGAALIEEHQAIVRERLIEPRRRGGGMERAGCLMAGTALEEHQIGERLASFAGDDAGEDLDGAVVGVVAPHQGDGERVLLDGEIQQTADDRAHGHITFPM